eukprot:6792091-Karenia_brevis.AAC.1
MTAGIPAADAEQAERIKELRKHAERIARNPVTGRKGGIKALLKKACWQPAAAFNFSRLEA